MTEPTAEHIQRACDLLNAEDGMADTWRPAAHSSYCAVRALSRQLAREEAEAERVRKMAEEIVRLASATDLALGEWANIEELAKSLLPPEPVDSLVDIVLKAKISAGVSAAYCAQLLHEVAAKQGKVIKIEDRP